MLGKLRDSVHYYLYAIANGAAMNGFSENSEVVAVIPWWQPVMYGVITVFAVLEVVFLILVMRTHRKNKIRVEEGAGL